MVRDIQNVMASPTYVAGFLQVSTSMGMSPFDPLTHTFAMHRSERTLIATVVEWSKGEHEHAGCILRSLLADGTLIELGEIAFENAPTMPGSVRTPVLIPKPPRGADRREALLSHCLAIC